MAYIQHELMSILDLSNLEFADDSSTCSKTRTRKLSQVGQNTSRIELEAIDSAFEKGIGHCDSFLIDFVSVSPPKECLL